MRGVYRPAQASTRDSCTGRYDTSASADSRSPDGQEPRPHRSRGERLDQGRQPVGRGEPAELDRVRLGEAGHLDQRDLRSLDLADDCGPDEQDRITLTGLGVAQDALLGVGILDDDHDSGVQFALGAVAADDRRVSRELVVVLSDIHSQRALVRHGQIALAIDRDLVCSFVGEPPEPCCCQQGCEYPHYGLEKQLAQLHPPRSRILI